MNLRTQSQSEFSGTERFEILRRLGSGGMGVVYEALDRESGEKVALKTLKNPSAQTLYQLKNEFRGLQDLQHRNLCGLGELLEESGQWFFTMELLEGVDFLTYVRADQDDRDAACDQDAITEPLTGDDLSDGIVASAAGLEESTSPGFDEERLRAALGQLALGLGELHRSGKVHRDIKPSNIMVTEDDRVVLLDFGLATDSVGEEPSSAEIGALSDTESIAATFVGTIAYMAPEQAAQLDVGSAADWYAVGVMLYEAMTGRLPFVGNNLKVLQDKQQQEPSSPRSHVPTVSTALDTLCMDLLVLDPAARPTSAQMRERLGVEIQVSSAMANGGLHSAQNSVFVGRTKELEVLAEAFKATRVGTASSVIVFGESGVGKSALIIEATTQILRDSPETAVLRGRCYERESVPFKAFDGVVDALSRHMRRLPREEANALLPDHASLLLQVFPVLGRVEAFSRSRASRASIGDPHQLRNQAFAALKQLFTRLAEQTDVVVVIDDWQWADKDSEVLLKDLLRSADAPTVLLLVSARPEARATLARSSAFPVNTQELELGGLSVAAAAELSERLMRRAGLETLDADELASEAQGHPLYIDALVRHAARVGQGAHILRLDDALALRVSEFAPDARRVAELVCVAGEPITQAVLRNAANVTRSEYGPIVSLLRVAHTLRGRGARDNSLIEPYHDRVREAVLASLNEDEHRAHHQSLAVAMEIAGSGVARPELLLRHLEAAGQHAKAAEHAIDAAEKATKALAFDRSAGLYEVAMRLGDFDPRREQALRLALATALANAGRGPEAAENFLAAARGGDRDTRRDCQRQAAEQWLKSGHIKRGLDAMSALLSEIGVSMPATPARTLLSLLRYRMQLRLGGYRFTVKPESEIPRDMLARIDVLVAVSCGLNMVDQIMGANFQAQGLLLSQRAGARFRIGRALVVEAAQAAATGTQSEYKRAYALLDKVTTLSDGDAFLDAWGLVGEGAADYLCGRLISAEEKLEGAELALRPQARVNWELGQLRVFRLSNLRRLGALAKMDQLTEDYLRDAAARGDLYAQTSITLCCARVWLRDDDVAEARRRLASVSWTPPEDGYHLQHWYNFSAEIEFELYEGNTTDMLTRWQSHFVSLKKALLLRIMIVRTEASWIRGRLALASALRAGPKEATRLLRIASSMARSLKKEKDAFASVASLLLYATIAAQKGDPGGAKALLRQAISMSTRVGTRLHGASARHRLGELVSGHAGRELMAEAAEAMRAQGIKNPTQMVEVFLPGFPKP